jgi:hypothetical protein
MDRTDGQAGRQVKRPAAVCRAPVSAGPATDPRVLRSNAPT